METQNTEIKRNEYGEIISGIPAGAWELIREAASKNKIQRAYDGLEWTGSRRRRYLDGDALHHEIYDITPDCRRVLLCLRATEGTKYGVRTTSKDYVVIARHGRGVRVIPARKAVAAKAAKACVAPGDAIEVALGRAVLPLRANIVRTGYKLLVSQGDEYRSAWDDSAWRIGEERIEAATDNHTGGYYYYAELDECLTAAAANDVFGEHREHHKLVVVEVEARGRHYEHSATVGTKLCATRVRPVRVVACTL